MSAPNACENCKFWNAYELLDQNYKPADGWGSCELTYSSGGVPQKEGTLAVAVDAEIYSASLDTHKTFYCNQHVEMEVYPVSKIHGVKRDRKYE